jgi:general secretion pathway protein E
MIWVLLKKTVGYSMTASLLESLSSDPTTPLPVNNPPLALKKGEFSRIIGSWAKTYAAVPVCIENNVLIVATCKPVQPEALRILESCYALPVIPVLTSESELNRILNAFRSSLMSDRSYALDDQSKSEDASEDSMLSSPLKIDVTDAEDEDAPIIRYVNALIFRAANQRASDIHIEPFEKDLKVRFRIDGVLQDVAAEDKYFQSAISSRIKVMANLNIAEKRLPQDGRIGLRIAGQDVDIRVSTVPTRYGERIVLRLLDKSKGVLDLTHIGFDQERLSAIRKLIKKSYGIFLVTGPTGSGKTTTLYACLSEIHSVDKNILTIEDPIEYEVEGVGQMQVNPKIDFTFASGLRSILRQDPDVIMVGEIRDLETVEIAIQASLTGHLVFSTLHTNDAPGAITRLLDMGVEPFLISSSLLGILAQRLVRRLCSECKVECKLSASDFHELQIPPEKAEALIDTAIIYKPCPGGCVACQGTSYAGRSAIHELLLIDDKVKPLIMNRANAGTIRQSSMGHHSLRTDGAAKVLAGLTSVEEVLRVTQEEGSE